MGTQSQLPSQSQAPAQAPVTDIPANGSFQITAHDMSCNCGGCASGYSAGGGDDVSTAVGEAPTIGEAPAAPQEAGGVGGSGSTTFASVATSHYAVQGATVAAAFANVRAGRAGRGNFDGVTRWTPSWSGTTSGGQVATANVTVTPITIRMPQWTAPSTAPGWHQTRWDEYYSALLSHEQGHDSRIRLEHGADGGYANAHTQLSGVSAATARANWTTITTQASATQVAYDATTQHGQTGSPPVVMDESDPGSVETEE